MFLPYDHEQSKTQSAQKENQTDRPYSVCCCHLSALYDTLGQHKQLSSSDVVLIFPLCSASFQQYPQAENAGI